MITINNHLINKLKFIKILKLKNRGDIMLRGLTRAGLGDIGSQQRFVVLAAQHGFESVDLDPKELIDEMGLQEAIDLLKKCNISIGAMGLPVEWRGTEEEFQEGLLHLAESAHAAAELGCKSCCTYVLPSTDIKPAHFMVLATRRLRTIADVLAAFDIRLGLEFVGPHHLRTAWKYPFIWTLQETLDWIDTIQRNNVGLLLDAYHWYTNDLSFQDIESLRSEQIVHVHINDAPQVPVEEVLDNNRLFPGEGVIDLVGFLQALNRIGYKGAITQEILTPSQPTDSVDILLKRSKDGYDKIFSAVKAYS
jgi:sugar phosphate isomerase/epimerase